MNEFLVLFSAPDAPPQLKYYLLPDIAENLKHSVKNVILDNTLVRIGGMSERENVTNVKIFYFSVI